MDSELLFVLGPWEKREGKRETAYVSNATSNQIGPRRSFARIASECTPPN